MNPHIIIIGAGPTGLCLARALAQRGWNVEIVERQPIDAIAAPAFDGREIALTHRSLRLLEALDAWRHIPHDEIAPLRRARVMDGSGGDFEVDGHAFDREALGMLVPNRCIRAAAWATVASHPRVRVRAGARIEAIGGDAERAWVRLAEGETLHAPLLVAADSRHSEARRAMGIAADMHDFASTMLVCRVAHAERHNGIAWEWFGHGQTRAMLPLREHLASLVLTVRGTEAQRLERLPADAFVRELEARFEGRLGAMELASTRHAYPLVATWARRFVGRRFALVGDAAVGMHPVTAHGFNLGLAGVESLAQAIGGAGAERDPGEPARLARFERDHRRRSRALYLGTCAVVRLFTDDSRAVQPLRRAIMQAWRHVPPLRRALAAGLIDDGASSPSPWHRLRAGFEVLRPRSRE